MDSLNSRYRIVKSGNGGQCVLYIMRRDQRVAHNHALLAAQKIALDNQLPLAVVFCLQPATKWRSREQYKFMLEGLKQIEHTLQKYDIPLIMLLGDPKETLSAIAHHTKPHSVVFDFSPLRGPRNLIQHMAGKVSGQIVEVDAHNIIPVWRASQKQEVGARTLRPKLHRLLPEYLVEPSKLQKHPFKWSGTIMRLDQLTAQIESVIAGVPSNHVVSIPDSGEQAAANLLDYFVEQKLGNYLIDKNNPTIDGISGLSTYLHFGQISSLQIALRVYEAVAQEPSLQASADAFLEELIVRKELSDNFCYFNTEYDNLRGAPTWAQQSLGIHANDSREYLYTFEEFRDAKTHDYAWNACQNQLQRTGKMHGYMRMYWAKKILEWSTSPIEAIDIASRLNDFYSWDGGDPNGYVGILWSIAGLHDRPWFDRPVYGVVRYMNYNGLKRKFDIAAYETKWLQT